MPKRDSVDRKAREWIAKLAEKRMKEMGLSQAELARRLEMSEGTISLLMHGSPKGLGLDQVLKLHRKLHIDGNLLLGEPPAEQADPPRLAHSSAHPGGSQDTGRAARRRQAR